MGGRAPLVLVGLLLCAAAGPMIAAVLPPGPASLLDPAGAAIATASIAVLWALFAWPVFARDRSIGTVLGEGLLLFFLAAPFVIGTGLSFGTRWAALWMALWVIAGSIAVAGLWLAGPGRGGVRDRWFVAFWVLIVAVVPVMNWVLMDFAGMRGTLGFRISPVLAARRILVEAPGADPVPFLVTGLVFLAATTTTGMLRKGATGVVLLLLASGASAAEFVPLLGDRYVPGRPVPMRLEGVKGQVTVRLPGRWVKSASAGSLLFVPGTEGLCSLEVDGEVVPLDLRPVPPGRLLTALGPVPPDMRMALEKAGFTIRRADREVDFPDWRPLFSVDGVLDPSGFLPPRTRDRLRGYGVNVIAGLDDLPDESPLRRPWEEPGRILSAEGLDRMFPIAGGPDPSRARTALVILALFAASALAFLRFSRLRGWSGASATRVTGAFAAVAVLVAVLGLPPAPFVRWAAVSATFGGRMVRVQRIHAVRETVAYGEGQYAWMVLGRGREATIGYGHLEVPLGARETRLLVQEAEGRPVQPGSFDFFLTPDGLAKPGEAALPPGEFLKRHLPGPDGQLVRKLLRIDGSLKHRYGVRLPAPGRLEVLRIP